MADPQLLLLSRARTARRVHTEGALACSVATSQGLEECRMRRPMEGFLPIKKTRHAHFAHLLHTIVCAPDKTDRACHAACILLCNPTVLAMCASAATSIIVSDSHSTIVNCKCCRGYAILFSLAFQDSLIRSDSLSCEYPDTLHVSRRLTTRSSLPAGAEFAHNAASLCDAWKRKARRGGPTNARSVL